MSERETVSDRELIWAQIDSGSDEVVLTMAQAMSVVRQLEQLNALREVARVYQQAVNTVSYSQLARARGFDALAALLSETDGGEEQ